ncbi:sugar porter (SP) family MFS transporter [Novosphingobium sp. SG751A]|uniref:sugar porter family MFS transporter n=1 Tax=Novosphingobium sp. SG751A TaxID=2587000 RepID=UPI0015553A14|nr:sugar porter family MFS transporter [Novosphingobium sp. SG751A]NOW48253.1 sugar porter (SP) family MFS transporter [Novosphingobium sp. SG751A]
MAARCAMLASMAGLLFGIDTAVISGVTQALQKVFALSPQDLGLAVSAALWGTLVGAALAGRAGDALGSRRLLLWVGWLYVVSALGTALANGLVSFCLFRLLGGLAIGASSVVAPVYISEISAPAVRGRRVGMFQCAIVSGILLAYLSNALVARGGFGAMEWRIKLGLAGVPALCFAVLAPWLPDSPRWLQARGRNAQAAADRLRLVLEPAAPVMQDERLSWRLHRKPILLALAIGAFNQLSGINAILYYLNDIFAAAGFSGFSADTQAVAVGLANLLATLAGMAMIDRLGRRPLLLAGALGTFAALVGVTMIFAGGQGREWLLPLLVMFIGFFAVSQGAVIWVYLSELFPTAVRARGQALGSSTHWVFNGAISFIFPVLAAQGPALPFAGFTLAMAVQVFVVWRWFPETRGASLDDLARRLAG